MNAVELMKSITKFNNAIPFEAVYDEDLGYVLGVIFGDGSMGKVKDGKYFRYLVQLEVKKYDFAKAFADSLSRVLKRKPLTIWPNPKKKTYYVSVSRKMFYHWFKSLNLRKLLLENREVAIGFIHGFFDSEGTMYHKREQAKFDCTDKHLMELNSNVLRQLGIKNTLHRLKQSSQWKSNYFIWRIRIPKEDFKRFKEMFSIEKPFVS